MTPEDTQLALLGAATGIGGFVIARAAIDDFLARRAPDYDQEEFRRAHEAAFGIRPEKPPVMNEVVALIAVLTVTTAAMIQATRWAVKQAGQ